MRCCASDSFLPAEITPFKVDRRIFRLKHLRSWVFVLHKTRKCFYHFVNYKDVRQKRNDLLQSEMKQRILSQVFHLRTHFLDDLTTTCGRKNTLLRLSNTTPQSNKTFMVLQCPLTILFLDRKQENGKRFQARPLPKSFFPDVCHFELCSVSWWVISCPVFCEKTY